MSSDKRSTDQRLDDLSATLDRVLGIVQDHSGALSELKADTRQIRVEMHEMRVEMHDLASAFREHLGWHLRQQPGGPGPGS